MEITGYHLKVTVSPWLVLLFQLTHSTPVAVSAVPKRMKLKVALVGPKGAGKTKLANYVAGLSIPTAYDPTVGVRSHSFYSL